MKQQLRAMATQATAAAAAVPTILTAHQGNATTTRLAVAEEAG